MFAHDSQKSIIKDSRDIQECVFASAKKVGRYTLYDKHWFFIIIVNAYGTAIFIREQIFLTLT